MLNVKKLSKEEMKLIVASAVGDNNNPGKTYCGTEPDPNLNPQAHQYWKSCMEANGSPAICPPGDNTTNP